MRAALGKHGVARFVIKPVRRSYAFERPGVPHGQQWVLKVRYPASSPALPLELTGAACAHPNPISSAFWSRGFVALLLILPDVQGASEPARQTALSIIPCLSDVERRMGRSHCRIALRSACLPVRAALRCPYVLVAQAKMPICGAVKGTEAKGCPVLKCAPAAGAQASTLWPCSARSRARWRRCCSSGASWGPRGSAWHSPCVLIPVSRHAPALPCRCGRQPHFFILRKGSLVMAPVKAVTCHHASTQGRTGHMESKCRCCWWSVSQSEVNHNVHE